MILPIFIFGMHGWPQNLDKRRGLCKIADIKLNPTSDYNAFGYQSETKLINLVLQIILILVYTPGLVIDGNFSMHIQVLMK